MLESGVVLGGAVYLESDLHGKPLISGAFSMSGTIVGMDVVLTLVVLQVADTAPGAFIAQ